jgi:hypothetical protein
MSPLPIPQYFLIINTNTLFTGDLMVWTKRWFPVLVFLSIPRISGNCGPSSNHFRVFAFNNSHAPYMDTPCFLLT